MIINASSRTDIPAYFSEWFFQRLKAGYVYVRNPYYPTQVTKYILHPEVVDSIVFCTKNPHPMLPRLNLLKDYHPYFFVTVTPYEKEIEPHVPSFQDVVYDIQELSLRLGSHSVSFRYDPIFINQYYTIEKHIETFDIITKQLEGYTHECVISFIDLYEKTKKNFPGIQEVSVKEQQYLAEIFAKIATQRGIHIKTCAEKLDLSEYGIGHEGCMTRQILKDVTGYPLKELKSQPLRQGCHCYPSRDIGEYDTCLHGCIYCYANENKQLVQEKYKRHDPLSPLLIGHIHSDDVIKPAKQESYLERQISFDL